MPTVTPNRWRIPIGAVLVHICIGSVYAWSTFNRPIQQLFPDQPWWFSPPYTTFTTALALLGLSAAFGGPWVERRPFRRAAAVTHLQPVLADPEDEAVRDALHPGLVLAA